MAYQLTYFDMRGRAESIRILFALADVFYVDNRVRHTDFAKLKPSLPFGQLPTLTLDNGVVLSQSSTIGRFLAKKFGFHGKDEIESAQIDEICDCIVDHELAYWSCFDSKLEAATQKTRLENYMSVITPKYFSKFDQNLERKNGQYMVGESVTFADVRLVNHIEFFSEMTETNLIADFPYLQELARNITNIPRIKKWMSQRPVSSVRKEEEEYDSFHHV
ncbi:glutathione S-transferase 1-like [Bradysia coprophila]|uniref:glutathione S-transferase 1-like n=1 Tax=Bradysia coprophila TaxID=38358 RepID=UPI00187D8313|nr:glutathione S-transferase 1-like [Bradysia coprophila]